MMFPELGDPIGEPPIARQVGVGALADVAPELILGLGWALSASDPQLGADGSLTAGETQHAAPTATAAAAVAAVAAAARARRSCVQRGYFDAVRRAARRAASTRRDSLLNTASSLQPLADGSDIL